jgi:SAM-dependent methyltransferase
VIVNEAIPVLARWTVEIMDAAFWNNRYAAPGYVYGETPNVFLAEMALKIPAGPVLCLAEGEGRNAVHLATLGHRVTAVDQSEAGLAKARRLAASRGVQIETVVADLENFTIEPVFWAGIVATFAHLPPAIRRKVHSQAGVGLRRGGVFILEAYTPAQLAFDTGGPKSLELLMTLASLREELSGLEFPVGREIEREVIEGDGHTGRGAVVQILARRHE